MFWKVNFVIEKMNFRTLNSKQINMNFENVFPKL